MKLGISTAGVKERLHSFGHFLFTYSRMIYFVLFVCALIGAILGLNIALNQPSDEDYRAKKLDETQTSRFDTETIEKIKNLNAKQQTTTDTLPTGQRINPFGE